MYTTALQVRSLGGVSLHSNQSPYRLPSFLEALGENPLPAHLGSQIPDMRGPKSLLPCQLPVTRSPQAHLFDLLFFPFKLLNGKITGITCIIQNNLPISKSLTLTKSAKSLLSVCKSKTFSNSRDQRVILLPTIWPQLEKG